jgi:hypothetical protein
LKPKDTQYKARRQNKTPANAEQKHLTTIEPTPGSGRGRDSGARKPLAL